MLMSIMLKLHLYLMHKQYNIQYIFFFNKNNKIELGGTLNANIDH